MERKQIVILAAVVAGLALVGAAGALITSYGSITGAATVKQAIRWDIITSDSDVNSTITNDTSYSLETTYQGDVKWVKLKLFNDASNPLPVNIVSNSSSPDVNITLLDVNKSSSLSLPISVPSGYTYIWIKHEFRPAASPGSYSFNLEIMPVG
jgi:hypothetical protein